MRLKHSIAAGGFFALFLGHIATICAQSLQPQAWQYTVKKNDSLHLICRQFCAKNADVREIAQFNQIPNPNLLRPNQTLSIPFSYLKVTVLPAQVLNANGDVRIKKNGSEAFQPLSLSDAVNVGDAIETGVNSIAKIKFADGTISTLQSKSSLVLVTSHQYAGKLNYTIKIKLSSGRTEVVANPQHLQDDNVEVETPTAVAVVRGTEFRVGAESTKAIEETLQGLVAFSADGQAVNVVEQFGTVARAGEPPMAPQKLPEAPNTQGLSKNFYGNQASFDLPLQAEFSWVAQLAKDQTFNEVVYEQVGTGTLQFQDLPIGQYFLKLRYQDAQGLQSADAVHAFEVKAALPALILIAPLGQTLTGNLNEFTWKDLPLNQGYLVQIASDENFKNIVLNRVVSYSKLHLLEALPQGKYYWRVAAKYAGRVPEKATDHFSESGQFSF